MAQILKSVILWPHRNSVWELEQIRKEIINFIHADFFEKTFMPLCPSFSILDFNSELLFNAEDAKKTFSISQKCPFYEKVIFKNGVFFSKICHPALKSETENSDIKFIPYKNAFCFARFSNDKIKFTDDEILKINSFLARLNVKIENQMRVFQLSDGFFDFPFSQGFEINSDKKIWVKTSKS